MTRPLFRALAFALLAAGSSAQDPGNEFNDVVQGAMDDLTGSGGPFSSQGPTPYGFGKTENDAPAQYDPGTGEITFNDETLNDLFDEHGIGDDPVAQESFVETILAHELEHQHTCPTTPAAPKGTPAYWCQHLAAFLRDYNEACAEAASLEMQIEEAEQALEECQQDPNADCSAEAEALANLESQFNGKCSVLAELYEMLADAAQSTIDCGAVDTSGWPAGCATDFGTPQQQGSNPPNLVPVCEVCTPV